MSIRFRLEIACENDAFQPECDGEVARILRAVADSVERGNYVLPYGMKTFAQTIRDINGNDVGRGTYENTHPKP